MLFEPFLQSLVPIGQVIQKKNNFIMLVIQKQELPIAMSVMFFIQSEQISTLSYRISHTSFIQRLITMNQVVSEKNKTMDAKLW